MTEKGKVADTIAKIYYDPGGFGSIHDTYKEAKAKEKSITLNAVKDWFERNIERKKQLRGYNSYVSKGPRDEYEVDLFDVDYLGQREFPYGLLAIDNFTKYMWVVPLKGKDGLDLIRGMKSIISNMQKPRKIYSDQESAMLGKEFQKWLREVGILHITTRNHANTAERAIRTFKDLMTRRLEGPGNTSAKWYDALRLAVLMKYNQKNGEPHNRFSTLRGQ